MILIVIINVIYVSAKYLQKTVIVIGSALVSPTTLAAAQEYFPACCRVASSTSNLCDDVLSPHMLPGLISISCNESYEMTSAYVTEDAFC